ncbi:protein kinase domain-containing protein [Singulisphaera acidiphila]|uniref:Serine/threonine protein kinase n=1 Tax=Singulisphaera acidiphila (strain ATCC BAA-1392 / DSM 18658 / VKM B-2454 / MOB10) TaxID=886293 RepID=L0DL22_SINAD|nr:protein kinase [Singulisphaera acidiphila]AGA30089.1 serine/threonine protein kinase [Singulisphaera acidiphila DSM 18658]
MPDYDAETLAEQALMIGLVDKDQAMQARFEAEDGSPESLLRVLLRKGLLTSWQVERLQKGDPSGFFYGGCKVLFHIAEGTFARVYRGQRMIGGNSVAIKVLRQRFVSDPDAISRFRKEAEAGMKLVHPNIVQILDFGEEDKKHYMMMEYVEGTNLRDLLKIRTRIDAAAALPMMIGLAAGLQYSFEHGVTHRDIKGTNILISNNGTAKLVDFGLATIEGDNSKSASLNQRTVDYSALERTCNSPKGDPRSDIYFLGCVFYQMLTGQLAMAEVESKDPLQKMLKRSFGAIKPLSDQRHAPDPELTRIIEKMMKVDVKSRYQLMSDVYKDLVAFQTQQQSQTTSSAERAEAEGRKSDEFDFDSLFTYKEIEPVAPVAEPKKAPEPEIPSEVVNETEPDHLDFEIKAIQQKHILCVETQSEIQDAFRKSLSKLGYRVILVSDAERAAERYRETTPDAVIFDVDGFGDEGIDAFIDMHDKAHEDEHDLAAVVLLGPKQAGFKGRLPNDDRLIVFVKPVKMKDIQGAIVQLVPAVG